MMQKMTQWFFGLVPFRRRKEKIEITVETNETWGVQWFRQSKSEICPVCGSVTIFISPDLGAQLVQADISLIRGLIDSGQVHFNESDKNEQLICLSSLKRSMEKHSLETLVTEG